MVMVQMEEELRLAYQQDLSVSHALGVRHDGELTKGRPTVLSSLAGVLTTVVNVYSARDGVWSITAKIAAIVTGSCAGVSLALFLIYNFWALRGVRKEHNEEFPEEYRKQEKQKQRESFMDKMKRKAHEPAIQPGSVV